MTKAEIKEIAKQVYKEEQEYQQLFKTMLAKSGKDINSMSDEDKKKFFSAVDKAYKAKAEGKLTGYDKKQINEIMDFFSIFAMAILGKIILYWLIQITDKGIKYFNGDSDNKKIIVDILSDLSNDRGFVDSVSKIVDPKRGIDNASADRIVKMRRVQSAISSKIKSKDDKKEIEDGLKSVFLKAWSDSGIMNTVISNVKNDIKK